MMRRAGNAKRTKGEKNETPTSAILGSNALRLCGLLKILLLLPLLLLLLFCVRWPVYRVVSKAIQKHNTADVHVRTYKQIQMEVHLTFAKKLRK